MLTNDNIENLKRKIDDLKLRHISERKTREQLIDLTLRYLGWDVSNYKRVDTEYSIPGLKDNTRWVDYALLDENRNPVVFVEAKRLGSNLGDESIAQLRHYGALRIFEEGTQNFAFLVLTNGNDWRFYHLWHEKGLKRYYGDWCYELNLERDDIPEIRDNLNNLLIRQNVLSGDSGKYLEKLFIQHRIKEIWESILAGPDKALVDLVESKMTERGYKADQGEIKRTILGDVEPPQQDDGGKSKFQVKYGGKVVEGRNPTVVMGNVLALFADVCGIDRLIRACIDSDKTYPTVMTDEKAHEVEKTAKKRPLTEPLPRYSGYSYLAGALYNYDKRDRLNKLAEQLEISDRVKIELRQDDGDKAKGKPPELQVHYDGKMVEGKNSAEVLENVLTLFADTCGGMGKVADTCKDLNKNPTVMTSEEANKLKEKRYLQNLIKLFPNPEHSDYWYLAVTGNKDRKQRLEDLAKALGISERVKIELPDWVSQS